MSLAEVLAARDRFMPAHDGDGTLGLRKEAVWLHVPLVVAAGSDGRWVLDIDYAVLNRVDVYLLYRGRLACHFGQPAAGVATSAEQPNTRHGVGPASR